MTPLCCSGTVSDLVTQAPQLINSFPLMRRNLIRRRWAINYSIHECSFKSSSTSCHHLISIILYCIGLYRDWVCLIRCDKAYLGLERFEKLTAKTEATMCIAHDIDTFDWQMCARLSSQEICTQLKTLSFSFTVQFQQNVAKKTSTCCRNCLILHAI